MRKIYNPERSKRPRIEKRSKTFGEKVNGKRADAAWGDGGDSCAVPVVFRKKDRMSKKQKKLADEYAAYAESGGFMPDV